MTITLQQIVVEELDRLGRNPFEAARIGGLERTYVNDIVTGRKKTLRNDKIPKLAQALGLSTEEFTSKLLALQHLNVKTQVVTEYLDTSKLIPALTVFFENWLLSMGSSPEEAEVTAPSAAKIFVKVLKDLPAPPRGLTSEQMVIAEAHRLFHEFAQKQPSKKHSQKHF
jgi:plasmid maintenance system antidote protein VapI